VIVLASASPRRAHLLRSLGVSFEVKVSHVDETLAPGETALAACARLARAKAAAVATHDPRPVLAADTLVVSAGRVLAKPESAEEAAEMLRLLSGRAHEVVTGVCLFAGGAAHVEVVKTVVHFATLRAEEIAWYVATGEPMDKAGGYHVDGRGALFITAIDGSPSNVAGLPVRTVLELARAAGVELF
jgi:septum formation protein